MRASRFALACASLTLASHAAVLDGASQKRVRAATFEVVVPKPSEGAVKYERPPPFELLPFSERTDKFWPVGTAFAISPDTFVTAAHVLSSAIDGQGGPPVLRDARGKTHAIGQILKYSAHQDFVVFAASVRASQTLETSETPQLDEPVFAVGNAFGEGVVVRDGLLTSLTPEEQDGRWKWLRYSAATSPGNSGGPLLDAAGKVVGVVIGKSGSENLNYALPIEYVLGSPPVARFEQRFPMRVPMLRDAIVAKLDLTIPLPLPLGEFTRRVVAENLAQYRIERSRLLAEKAAELPPRGKSDKLLDSVEWAACPMIIVQSKERDWEPDDGSRENADIANGGKVCTRVSGALTAFSLDRGKDTNPAFYTDRQHAFELLMQGSKLSRGFGAESVDIISLGPPVRDVPHRDRHGRAWSLTTFAVPYLDAHIMAAMLPTPNGYSGLLSFVPRGKLDFMADALTFATDYFYVTYEGTLPQWQAFLDGPTRPAALAGVKLTRDARGMHYRSDRVDFDVPPTLLKLDDSATLQLRMSYSRGGAGVVWSVGAIYVSDEQKDERYFSLARQPKPAQGAPKELADRWADMLDARGQFAPGRGHDADFKKLWRSAVIGAGYRPGDAVGRDATLLYAVSSRIDGAKLPREIDDLHDQLLENVRVKER
jgi:serine protease Do